jgi:Domain of unknown function (DUF4806)
LPIESTTNLDYVELILQRDVIAVHLVNISFVSEKITLISKNFQRKIVNDRMLYKKDLKTLFRTVFSDSALVDYNWPGNLGKRPMKDLKIIWTVMYGT